MRTTIGTWAVLLPLAIFGNSACSGGGTANADANGPAPDANLVENPNGNPDGVCNAGLPLLGYPLDVSQATTVIGTGTAASCQFPELYAAVAAGGTITFKLWASAGNDCDCRNDESTDHQKHHHRRRQQGHPRRRRHGANLTLR